MRHCFLKSALMAMTFFSWNNKSLAEDYNVINEQESASSRTLNHTPSPRHTPPPSPLPERLSYLSLSLGKFDAFDKQDAADFRVEYRSGWKLLGPISPMLAVEVTSDSSVFAGIGLTLDAKPAQHIYITPAFTVGHYDKGDGRDLGSSLQFRSQFELGYEWTGGHRLGIAASHISNGGRKDYNPGTEILSVYYHIPLESLRP